MAENFNLIWGSNASQTTVWNDSDYQRGWETVGDTPPTAQQFDALQRRNDLKAQELNNTIAPIAEANDANNRKPQTVYNVGDMQYDSQLPTGWYMLCTVGGTSGDGDITFPTPLVEDASVLDGNVVWRLHKLSTSVANIDSLEKSLAESTGYGIVSGCEPTISGLTVTVGAGIVHLAGGTRKEIAQTNITLDNADPTNPRIDLVYINADGEVAKVTGTAAASPVVPVVPSGGISVAQVSVAAGANTGIVTYKMKNIRQKSFLLKDIQNFSKVATIINSASIGNAYIEAMTYNTKTGKIILSYWDGANETNYLATVNKNSYSVESINKLNLTVPIGVLSYNESKNVILLSCPNTNKFYELNADDLTNYTEIIMPAQTQFIAHDNKTGLNVASSNSGRKIKIFTNGFNELINTLELDDIDYFQDMSFYDGMLYGCDYDYLISINVFSGEYVKIPINSWNEIEGIDFVDDTLYVSIHQAAGNGVEYLYKYLPNYKAQGFNRIGENNVKKTDTNINLKAFTAEGIYSVSTDNTTCDYPSGETKGVLFVINGKDMNEQDNKYTITQKFVSNKAPFYEYTRTFVRNGETLTWSDWEQGERVIEKNLSVNGYIKYASGLIIQWGYIEIYNLSPGYQQREITYPIAFPHRAFGCIVGKRRGSDVGTTVGLEIYTQSSARLYFTMGSETALGCNYIVTGY